MSTARVPSNSRSLRQATLLLGVVVAAFVPVMQLIVDHSQPLLTKPVIAGAFLGLLIAGFCCLPRRWHLRLFLVSCMGVLTLGLAELGCSLVMAPVSASIYDWDDRCLYKTRPNSKKVFRRTAINGGQSSEVVINSQGFRGPDLPPKSNTPRVAIYGDSFIEAEYSQWENTFGERLREAATKLLGKPITVVNAGTNGYGPDQELLRMETELPQFQPELVILSIFADNDLGDLLRNKLFRLNERGEIVSNNWQRSAACQHPGMRGRYEPTLWKLARNAIRGLQSRGGVVESYMERWQLQCLAEYDEYVTRGNSEVHDLQADHYDADIALTPGVPSARYKADLFAKILERIDATCRRNHSQLLVVIIPSPADLIENYDFCVIDHQRFPDYDKHALSTTVAAAAAKRDIRSVNLYEAFSRQDPARLYFRGGDNHWNDDGQRLAAGIVAPVVAKMLLK